MESKNELEDELSRYKEKLENLSDYENESTHYKEQLQQVIEVK